MNLNKITNVVIPSIDLLDGEIVRLERGDFEKKIIFDLNFNKLIERYKDFSTIHIVNLNGAKGEKNDKNEKIIKEIRKKFKGIIQVGGGIRTLKNVEFWLKNGVDKVVIGSLCIKDIEETKKILKKYGNDKIVLAIDCVKKDDKYYPKINGWKDFNCDKKEKDIFYYLNEYKYLVKQILITDINKDGMMSGCNIELYMQIKKQFSNFKLQASGGVSCVDDVLKSSCVCDNVIIGRMLYEKDFLNNILKIDLQKNWKNFDFVNFIDWKKVNNLVPVVIQDCKTFDVLMLGYCNKEAIELTQKTEKMYFYSRTKNRIWMKGEESGNFLYVKDLKLDCDNDALLAIVEPIGNTCHSGNKSCFNYRVNFLSELENIIYKRLEENNIEKSYIAKLFSRGINKIAQKVGEEATEVVIAALNESDERFLEEGADLLFTFLLLLKKKNFELCDVVRVLKSRNK